MGADAAWFTEADVVTAVDLPAAVAAVRAVLQLEHEGCARTLPKTAVGWGDGDTLHALGGVSEGLGLVGTKTWTHTSGGATPLLVLWDAATGDLQAIVEAFALGQLRTASVSAVATDVLARPDAAVLAMVGTGKQALAQVAAVISQRPIREVRVFSPTASNRAEFSARLRDHVGDVDVVDCPDVASAVAPAHVITTATRSRQALLELDMIGDDVHVNALGAITPDRRELGDSLVAGAHALVSDSPAIAKSLSADLADVEEPVSLAQVVADGWTRTGPGPTVFKAMGLGLADIAVGAAVLDSSPARGGGRPISATHRAAPRLFNPITGGSP